MNTSPRIHNGPMSDGRSIPMNPLKHSVSPLTSIYKSNTMHTPLGDIATDHHQGFSKCTWAGSHFSKSFKNNLFVNQTKLRTMKVEAVVFEVMRVVMINCESLLLGLIQENCLTKICDMQQIEN